MLQSISKRGAPGQVLFHLQFLDHDKAWARRVQGAFLIEKLVRDLERIDDQQRSAERSEVQDIARCQQVRR